MSVESEILRIQHNIADAYAKVAEKGGEVPLQPKSGNLPAAIASIPGGSNLIAGDGLSKKGDTLSVANPNRGILTQAEFDALTDDQKASGTFFVDDGGGGGGSGSAGEVYSTEEQRIGTWIDGKPIYRKARPILLKNSTSNQQFDIGLTDVDTVIDLIVIVKRAPVDTGWVVSNYSSGSVFLTCGIRHDHLLWVSTSFADVAGQPAYVIVEYTKTTDEPTISTAEIVAAYLDGLPAEDLAALAEAAANDASTGEGGTV